MMSTNINVNAPARMVVTGAADGNRGVRQSIFHVWTEWSLDVLRFLMVLLGRMLLCLGYRLRAEGLERIPKTGGALLVCNHPSYMDPLLIQAMVGRYIRFVMYRPYYEKLFLRLPCSIMRVIPIDAADEPRVLLRSLKRVRQLVEAGHLVCVFAEGGVTRTGELGTFQRGVEVIMKGIDAPIIPLGLCGVWGSFLSFPGGRICWRPPFRREVVLRVGSPMSASSRVADIRRRVCGLLRDPSSRDAAWGPGVRYDACSLWCRGGAEAVSATSRAEAVSIH